MDEINNQLLKVVKIRDKFQEVDFDSTSLNPYDNGGIINKEFPKQHFMEILIKYLQI